jgi:hypothetical protein
LGQPDASAETDDRAPWFASEAAAPGHESRGVVNLPLILAEEPVPRLGRASGLVTIAALNHEVRAALDRVNAVEAAFASTLGTPASVAAGEALTAARRAYAKALLALHAATGKALRP